MPYSKVDAHIAELMKRNAEFVDSTDKEALQKSAREPQTPKVFWLGCSDSRVSDTTVVGGKLGEIFVHRNIANQFSIDDPSAASALAFAVNYLKVEHVVCVGHELCGGCTAALTAAKDPSSQPSVTPESDPGTAALQKWLGPLQSLASTVPASEEESATLSELVATNVRAQVAKIASSNIMKQAWDKGSKARVHGWVYELETGRLRDLDVTVGPQGPEED